jgi:hypothetical protein
MDESLERIVAADEEARARVANVRAEAAARVEAARARCRAQQYERDDTRRKSLAAALADIEGATERTIDERRAARARYAEARRQRAETVLAEAAEQFARIVRDGGPPRPTL